MGPVVVVDGDFDCEVDGVEVWGCLAVDAFDFQFHGDGAGFGVGVPDGHPAVDDVGGVACVYAVNGDEAAVFEVFGRGEDFLYLLEDVVRLCWGDGE